MDAQVVREIEADNWMEVAYVTKLDSTRITSLLVGYAPINANFALVQKKINVLIVSLSILEV
jgi:hypothetical protein